ncbi:excinuclease ABC subunit UvrA [Segatella bryantii]|jgi:excinuclease ABC subunit A|uniref:UvrABC system protein A n=1 Tax=Segatella bryantii TaxID=77095 RepID=A0ABX4EL66_SEGBR|nr:excinuclease ABC subunit UvrA [Segatella bryantii]MEE3414509.1 excinuclease ABC subunit UvrA [Prevotella sp.]MDR4930515.1 excinuclease ABC subunit UvrA [Segatella bryantii]OYP56910.1 excinuclease ABC subunit A [Segatella bryantii]UKK73946.1 excinuclease ABC subunit UvrA [Segatella bryantii]UKK81348.1 excinuclease ABC subunit UvrA [Segatella bryantii]
MQREDEKINVWGARVHNLKNIDVVIPRNSLTVITGLSGSGKSSLAFDTIFAEGQRRYIETFSAYARNFLGNMERPDVDKITGLSPVISIEQKTTNKNPRSTVGTTTEIYDYLRLLYARAGIAYSYQSGEKMVKYTEEKVIQMIQTNYANKRIYILAPLVRQRKGHYRELFESMRRKGYLYMRVDGEILEVTRGMKVDRYKNHNIEVVIDKLAVQGSDDIRLANSIKTAMKQGEGVLMIMDKDTGSIKNFSKRLMDPATGLAYSDPAPNMFSFNSLEGACHHCKGLGVINEIDISKVIPDNKKNIHDGAIAPLGKYKNQMIFWELEAILGNYDCTLKTPVKDIPTEAIDEILHGSLKKIKISKDKVHTNSDYFIEFNGIIKYLQDVIDNDESSTGQKWADQFMAEVECPECHGMRLKKESLSYKIWDKNISEVANMDILELKDWLEHVEEHLDEQQKKIAHEILKEIKTRINFLLDVGLDYLSLNRQSATLSGGESQRIRLATQIGSQLVNVLYILDEPSIGLHQRDNERLIKSLKELRDLGNTVIVVEHDEDMMRAADWIVDIGPKAGRKGGEVVFQGTPEDMLNTHTITADYLNKNKKIEIPSIRRQGNGKEITIYGAHGNNLKNVNISFPLGKLIVVTGVSGSGKSTLINETLQPILSQHFYRSIKKPMAYKKVEGIENIDKVVNVDQSPIGRTPRSNPATYTGVFSDIRALFVGLPEAKIRGYKPGRFSFNVKGGRCEACSGNGYKTIAMNFLPDVMVPCEVCHGKRYNRETLEVRFKGKSIADVLDMTINQAVEFFENVPQILPKIKTLQDVGLGYIKLGQSSTTLSGGESQRVKLATELAKKDTGKTLYILDEPTTGLHFEDIRILMDVLQKLVDRGNTVIIIEHNLDVIKLADWIIDVGPEGGRNGGHILATGTPEEISKIDNGFTSKFLKPILEKGS